MTRLSQPAFSAALLLLLCTPLTMTAAKADAIDIGSRLELFVDDHLVDETKGLITFHLHSPTPGEVVFRTDKPWEGNASGYFTLFQDGDLYRMYYRGCHLKTKHGYELLRNQQVCYAESRDGIHWTRPDLHQVDWNDGTDNNIIKVEVGAHNFTPFIDRNPECPPEERYKSVGRRSSEPGKGLHGFTSPDGIHWEPLPAGEPIMTKGHFDSQNVVFWDTVRDEYRVYHRTLRNGLRDIQTLTSDRFDEWLDDPAFLEYSAAPPEQLYTNSVLPYSRAPELFVGFPTRIATMEDGQSEPLFMSSRDGTTFQRWPTPIIPKSAPRQRIGNRANFSSLGVLRLPGKPDELSIYATEGTYRGDSLRLRRFTYRLDGFVSLRAPSTEEFGEILTKPLLFTGDHLFLNLKTGPAGSVRVEVATAEGKPIRGFRFRQCKAVSGDHISRMITWRKGADLSSLEGTPVRLRIRLMDADVFSLRFQ